MSTACAGGRYRWLRVLFGLLPAFALGRADPAGDFDAARRLYETRRYSDARSSFERLATTVPGHPEVDFYLGRLELWFDDGAAALARLERAVQLRPREARLHNALGDAYGLAAQNAAIWAKLGWAKKCLAAYERAVELEPDNPAFRWSLVGYHCMAPALAGGSRMKALAQAEAIRRLDGMGGRIAFATLHLAEKNADAAFAQFDDAIRERPDDFLTLYHIGRCAALSGKQLDRGLAALERCLSLSPPAGDGMPTRASVLYRRANILERKGDAAGARVAYAAAEAEDRDFRPAKMALKN